MADETQARAGLKVMVALARADGWLADAERQQISDALAELAPGESLDDIVSEDVDVDAELAKITDRDVQAATYRAAVLISMSDGEAHPEESKLLEKLRETFGLPNETPHVAKVLADAEALAPIESDPKLRRSQAQSMITGHAMMAGAFGANPIPLVSFVTEVGVFLLQARLIRNLGNFYGHELGKKDVAAMMAGTFGLGMARAAVVQLVKFVPVWGSVVGGATAFTATYALGETVLRHFEAGGDLASLTKREAKKVFDDLKKGTAKAEYEKSKDQINKRAKEEGPVLESLAKDLEEGKASDADLAAKLRGLE